MIRQQAFCVDGNLRMLKGGLHCHTTRSDGVDKPEDVIRFHKEHGYDFLAITDHRVYNYKNFVPDVDITIIPGMEFENIFQFDGYGFRCFHTVCIGPSREDGNGYEQDERPDSGKATNQFEYQKSLDEMHAKNNLTIYCHPQWSNTPVQYFGQLKGDFAMEIWNTGSAMYNEADTDAPYWDELLGQGKKIYGVAADDGHSMSEHCKGWVMVNAENNINAILAALEAGAFYSSCGPVIKDFYVEDGKAVVECERANRIRFHSDCHQTHIVRSEGGVTRAECKVEGNWDGKYRYVRAVVVGDDGKFAWTNPIWLE